MDPEILESELKRIDERIQTRRKSLRPGRQARPSRWKELVRRNHFGLMAALIAVGATVVMIVPIVLILEVTSVKPAAAQVGVASGNEDAATFGGPSTSIREARGDAGTLLTPDPIVKTAEDPIEDLLDRIQRRRFSAPEEVAAGQFLREFPVLVPVIDEIELSRLQPRRRGVGWTVLMAHSRMDHEPWEKPKPERAMQVRCAIDGGVWKVEQVIVLGSAS